MSFDVDHVAMLARLGLSADEKERLGAQLGAILEAIGTLSKVDTSHLPPTAQVGNLVNVWREDVAVASLPLDKAIGGAPEREGHHFTVGAIQE